MSIGHSPPQERTHRRAASTAVEMERRRPNPNIERLRREHTWPGACLSKTRIADACWLTLEAKLDAAIASGSAGPPIMRAAVHAWELASLPHRKSMVLQRHKIRDPGGTR